ncbi:hypothetical protein HanRHA438_Chr09g0383811 [Helianthus annuus]|nr:hypothetical protein HanRHA438_Chr09g0383811 [Helianthus annuus]
MHNVQHLKHQETQTIYPSTGSSSAVHFSHFFTRSRSNGLYSVHTDQPFHSLLSHKSHMSQNFISPSLSLSGDSRTLCQISPDVV